MLSQVKFLLVIIIDQSLHWLHTLNVSSKLILRTTLWGIYYDRIHFTEEKVNIGLKKVVQGQSGVKGQIDFLLIKHFSFLWKTISDITLSSYRFLDQVWGIGFTYLEPKELSTENCDSESIWCSGSREHFNLILIFKWVWKQFEPNSFFF